METLRKVIKIRENLENQKHHVYLQCSKKQKVLTVSHKTKKIKLWQQQIGQLSEKEKTTTKFT